MSHDATNQIWQALGGPPEAPSDLSFTGQGALPSWFATTDLAAASLASAGLAIAEWLAAREGRQRGVTIDRRLASHWFGRAIQPQGWEMAQAWDPIAGDYETRDGWIKLHTNAPHHRAAALAVLGAAPDREAVAKAVRGWEAAKLEGEIVAQGGAAAEMRSQAAWAAHPQGKAVAAEPLVRWDEMDGGPPPSWPLMPGRPLAGIRVLDMTRVLAGPVATRFLAGFGATVLRIDPPDWNEPGVVPDVVLGKHCARLDLRIPENRALWEELLRGADILVHGYRPGALDGLVLDADRRRALNPGLIEVALDAYGWTGPWSGRRGFDSLVQMSSGIAETGMRKAGADKPVPLPVQALDHATGYIMAAAAIRGLTRRLGTGRASRARCSLARTAALLTGMPVADEPAIGPVAEADIAEGIEQTSWGAARRVRAPCRIEGVPMSWDRPALDLGTATPRWPD